MAQTVSIGSIKVSQASFIILITAFILAVALLFVAPFGFLASIVVMLGGVLAAYNVNCVQVGHCKVWAYFLTAFYVFYAVMALLAAIALKKLGTLPSLVKKMRK